MMALPAELDIDAEVPHELVAWHAVNNGSTALVTVCCLPMRPF